MAASVAKIPTTSVRRFTSRLGSLQRVARPDLAPVVGRDREVRQYICFRRIQESGQPPEAWAEAVGHAPPLVPCTGGSGLGDRGELRGGQERGRARPLRGAPLPRVVSP